MIEKILDELRLTDFKRTITKTDGWEVYDIVYGEGEVIYERTDVDYNDNAIVHLKILKPY